MIAQTAQEGRSEKSQKIMPKSLERYAHLEDFVAQASSKFSKNEIDFAKSVLQSELTSSGILNPQIKTFASNDRGVVFKASIPTTQGRQDVEVPVEFSNGKPLMPTHFKYANKEIFIYTNNSHLGVFGCSRSERETSS